MFRKLKIKATMAMMFLLTIAMNAVALASDPAPTTQTIIQTGVTTLQGEIMGVIAVVVPVAFGITAAVIGIKFGIRFVRSLIGR
jgi:type IV secretory pathway VirB2 component (pilin)